MLKPVGGILVSLLLIAGLAEAGTIQPPLDEIIAEANAGEFIGAIVVMADKVDLGALKQELYARRADRREWHQAVVLALQEKATVSQADILTQLARLADQGLVRDYQSIWIGNVVLVTAAGEAFDILVQRDDVLQINLDYEIENIKPVSKGDDSPPLTAGVEAGLKAIRADEVWAMGITGAGRLVSHLDTGVDGNHPALNARWRGYDPRYAGNPGWAWFDPLTNTQFPQDWGSHGTHTMGTICGLGQSTGDTIGVAFGAEWISAGVIDRVSIPQTISDAILSFQWIADPDGNPSTVWDVPDVCSNSWGISEIYHGYDYCDPMFWSVLDGCQAAGVFVVFAAGNEGYYGARTIRNPATRATTDIQSFAVGALNGNDPDLPIADFSSRGPSECTPGGEDAIKPEVSAPGVDVRSSVPGGGYQGGWDGTSMACPHVAGVVALMREANPNLTTDQIGEILLETATDLGAEGEDNAYGMGIVDAYEAVMLAISNDGACCDPVDGSCAELSEEECQSAGGIFKGNGTTCLGDADGDAVDGACDNCPDDYNPGQEDFDDDGIGDTCDNCPEEYNPGQEDVDSDGVGDLCDNCPDVYNPGQEDSDADGYGDVCDPQDIPTLSEWGMIMMALLLLAVGTVALVRRRNTAFRRGQY
jgi:subtilisin family serine protease